MPFEIIPYWRSGEDSSLLERELKEVGKCGKGGRKDEGTLRAIIFVCLAQFGLQCPRIDTRPIEGKQYDGKLWEIRVLKSARSDGVHGYRIFYKETRNPKTGQRVLVLTMLYAKKGRTTPPSVYAEAWKRLLEVERLLAEGKFFEDED